MPTSIFTAVGFLLLLFGVIMIVEGNPVVGCAKTANVRNDASTKPAATYRPSTCAGWTRDTRFALSTCSATNSTAATCTSGCGKCLTTTSDE